VAQFRAHREWDRYSSVIRVLPPLMTTGSSLEDKSKKKSDALKIARLCARHLQSR